MLTWACNKKKIRNEKIITLIGSLTFGVYLLHDNDLIRNYLWKAIEAPRFLDNVAVELIYMVCVVLGIFIVGCIVECVRKKVVRLLKMEDILGRTVDRAYIFMTQKIEKTVRSIEANECKSERN